MAGAAQDFFEVLMPGLYPEPNCVERDLPPVSSELIAGVWRDCYGSQSLEIIWTPPFPEFTCFHDTETG